MTLEEGDIPEKNQIKSKQKPKNQKKNNKTNEYYYMFLEPAEIVTQVGFEFDNS